MRRTASGALSALAVLALGFVVALAADSVPGRAGDEPLLDLAWHPAGELESILTWLIIIAAVVGALILVFAAKQGSLHEERKRGGLVVLVLGVLMFALIARFVRSISGTLAPETSEVIGDAAETPIGQVADSGLWMLSLLVAAVLAIALAKVGLAIRRGAPPIVEPPPVEETAPIAISDVIATSYGEGGRGRVFGAYADFEQALGEAGLPRSPAETAARHVGRATALLDLSAPDVLVLSARHAGARFGPHEPTLDEVADAESASQRLQGEIQQ